VTQNPEQEQQNGGTPPGDDLYRGAQYDKICRLSGALSIAGGALALALMALYPPTAQIGAWGWVLVVPMTVLSIVVGALRMTLRVRPTINEVYGGSVAGVAELSLLQWLAGGGHAPFVQLMLLPMIGVAGSLSVRRCGVVVALTLVAALLPAAYSSIDLLGTTLEFALAGTMTLMLATVFVSTRSHRALLKDAGDLADRLAHVDQLTGMPNRRAFDEELELGMQCAHADGTPLSIVLCDVNSFKQINDRFGHAAGDDALRAIARALGESVRKPESAFRWAGDEFAVILHGADQAGAERVAKRLRESVRKRCRRPDGQPIAIGAGVAQLRQGMTRDELLADADRALFAQKEARAKLAGVA
jgi:diguanylate cyclase (GGDEF)-like protein